MHIEEAKDLLLRILNKILKLIFKIHQGKGLYCPMPEKKNDIEVLINF